MQKLRQRRLLLVLHPLVRRSPRHLVLRRLLQPRLLLRLTKRCDGAWILRKGTDLLRNSPLKPMRQPGSGLGSQLRSCLKCLSCNQLMEATRRYRTRLPILRNRRARRRPQSSMRRLM